MWLARDKDNTLTLFQSKPERVDFGDLFYCKDEDRVMDLDENLYPEVTWENSPIEVELHFTDRHKSEIDYINKVLEGYENKDFTIFEEVSFCTLKNHLHSLGWEDGDNDDYTNGWQVDYWWRMIDPKGVTYCVEGSLHDDSIIKIWKDNN